MAAPITISSFRHYVAAERIIFRDSPAAMAEAHHESSANEADRKVLWTDASGYRGRVGVAIIWKADLVTGEQEWREDFGLLTGVRHARVGEGKALLWGLNQGERLYGDGGVFGDIILYTDADLIMVKRPPVIYGRDTLDTHYFGAETAARAVELADRGFRIEFKRCRGHTGILGNELADYHARTAVGLGPPLGGSSGWDLAHGAVTARNARRIARLGPAQMDTVVDREMEQFEREMVELEMAEIPRR